MISISYQIFVVINFIIYNGHNATLQFWNGSTNNRKIANKGKIMIFVSVEIVVEDTQNQCYFWSRETNCGFKIFSKDLFVRFDSFESTLDEWFIKTKDDLNY